MQSCCGVRPINFEDTSGFIGYAEMEVAVYECDRVAIGTFIERPNGFNAMVEINGIITKCYVKNIRRCKELLVT